MCRFYGSEWELAITEQLAAKLDIPQTHPESLARLRLLKRLQAISQQKLTLISRPAGFGKSTIMGEWITQNKRPAAWVSLDGGLRYKKVWLFSPAAGWVIGLMRDKAALVGLINRIHDLGLDLISVIPQEYT